MNKKKCQEYLQTKVHPILQKLVIDLLLQMPQDPLRFINKWVQAKILSQANVVQHVEQVSKPLDKQIIESNKTLSSQEDTYQEIVEIKKKVGQRNTGRTSVSAQAFGLFNKKRQFIPKQIKKSPSQIQRIQKRILKSFIFSSLQEKNLKIIINAMEQKKFKENQWVIKQYDDGNELYIVQTGELDCYKQFKKGDPPTYLKTYVSGQSFGQLALLYNVPRQASIKCKTPSVLWSLDRETFTTIVRDSAIAKKELHQQFLNNVELFKGMESYELSKLGQVLKCVKYQKGDYVCKQGEIGNEMYLVQSGQLKALKKIEGKQKQVFAYKPGDYFGEIVLIKEVQRQASIICKTPCSLLAINKDVFERIIGKDNEKIVKNFSRYQGLKLKK